MKKNMGKLDVIIRIIIAIAIIGLYVTEIISGTLGIVLIVLSIVFIVTSIIGFCPLYILFGIRTCPLKKKK